ncbi:MAG TPA: metal-dependent hydrolase [Methanospirillum sp.]|nr:metal-dependent hydrolase [Methanospirillum sp.]
MLILCHLFFGLCAGMLLCERYARSSLLAACIIGSILPDIIDKPLGYLIFPEIGDGRLITHALIGIGIIGIIGVLVLKVPLLTGALCTGVILHQLLDAMWKIPANWLYPLFGDFPSYPQENYFGWGLMRELSTPSEWAFAGAMLLLMIYIWSERRVGTRFRAAVVSGIPALILLIAGR